MSIISSPIYKYSEMLGTTKYILDIGFKILQDQDKAKMKIEPRILMIQQQECRTTVQPESD